MSHLKFWILPFSSNFCPLKSGLSGNTVWQQVSDFKKIAKIDHLWAFIMNFWPLKMYTLLASLAMLNATFSVIFKHRSLSLFYLFMHWCYFRDFPAILNMKRMLISQTGRPVSYFLSNDKNRFVLVIRVSNYRRERGIQWLWNSLNKSMIWNGSWHSAIEETMFPNYVYSKWGVSNNS